MTFFTIQRTDYRRREEKVVAPPGWTWTPDGCKREPKGFRCPGPEWSTRHPAYRFSSHRAAARVRNLCFDDARIVEHSA